MLLDMCLCACWWGSCYELPYYVQKQRSLKLAPEVQVRILNETLKLSGHALEPSVSTGALAVPRNLSSLWITFHVPVWTSDQILFSFSARGANYESDKASFIVLKLFE